jgi:hypothetical protein
MHRSVRPLCLFTALVAGPAMLAACSTSPATTTSAAARASAGAKAALALPKGVLNATGVPSAVPNDFALRKTVALTGCGQVSGGWRASGAATNHTSTAVDYTVTVFFTTARDTVIGTGDTKVHVDADATARWNVTSRFAAASGTQCVVRGVG